MPVTKIDLPRFEDGAEALDDLLIGEHAGPQFVIAPATPEEER